LSTYVQSTFSAASHRRNRELTLGDLWELCARRKIVILAPLVAMLIIAILICVFSERRYQAMGQLQVQKESMDGLGLSSMIGDSSGATDALDSNITIQTEASILQ
jgi:uncharacterized protein involved in exopolysaccharide biosynthesis